MKVCGIAVIFSLMQLLVCVPVIADEETAGKNVGDNRAYFEPRSPQVRPVHRPAGCGYDGTRNDSYIMDFEAGNVTVIPSYDGAKLLSLNLIFKYWEKDRVKISAEKVELHALPDERIFTPKKLYHRATATIPDEL